MLAEYKQKTNIGVGGGFLCSILGRVIAQDGGAAALAGLAIMLVGAGLFIWGCCQYAKGKGHHPAWGVLGLFSIFGLIVLFLFPDRHKEVKSA